MELHRNPRKGRSKVGVSTNSKSRQKPSILPILPSPSSETRYRECTGETYQLAKLPSSSTASDLEISQLIEDSCGQDTDSSGSSLCFQIDTPSENSGISESSSNIVVSSADPDIPSGQFRLDFVKGWWKLVPLDPNTRRRRTAAEIETDAEFLRAILRMVNDEPQFTEFALIIMGLNRGWGLGPSLGNAYSLFSEAMLDQELDLKSDTNADYALGFDTRLFSQMFSENPRDNGESIDNGGNCFSGMRILPYYARGAKDDFKRYAEQVLLHRSKAWAEICECLHPDTASQADPGPEFLELSAEIFGGPKIPASKELQSEPCTGEAANRGFNLTKNKGDRSKVMFTEPLDDHHLIVFLQDCIMSNTLAKAVKGGSSAIFNLSISRGPHVLRQDSISRTTAETTSLTNSVLDSEITIDADGVSSADLRFTAEPTVVGDPVAFQTANIFNSVLGQARVESMGEEAGSRDILHSSIIPVQNPLGILGLDNVNADAVDTGSIVSKGKPKKKSKKPRPTKQPLIAVEAPQQVGQAQDSSVSNTAIDNLNCTPNMNSAIEEAAPPTHAKLWNALHASDDRRLSHSGASFDSDLHTSTAEDNENGEWEVVAKGRKNKTTENKIKVKVGSDDQKLSTRTTAAPTQVNPRIKTSPTPEKTVGHFTSVLQTSKPALNKGAMKNKLGADSPLTKGPRDYMQNIERRPETKENSSAPNFDENEYPAMPQAKASTVQPTKKQLQQILGSSHGLKAKTNILRLTTPKPAADTVPVANSSVQPKLPLQEDICNIATKSDALNGETQDLSLHNSLAPNSVEQTYSKLTAKSKDLVNENLGGSKNLMTQDSDFIQSFERAVETSQTSPPLNTGTPTVPINAPDFEAQGEDPEAEETCSSSQYRTSAAPNALDVEAKIGTLKAAKNYQQESMDASKQVSSSPRGGSHAANNPDLLSWVDLTKHVKLTTRRYSLDIEELRAKDDEELEAAEFAYEAEGNNMELPNDIDQVAVTTNTALDVQSSGVTATSSAVHVVGESYFSLHESFSQNGGSYQGSTNLAYQGLQQPQANYAFNDFTTLVPNSYSEFAGPYFNPNHEQVFFDADHRYAGFFADPSLHAHPAPVRPLPLGNIQYLEPTERDPAFKNAEQAVQHNSADLICQFCSVGFVPSPEHPASYCAFCTNRTVYCSTVCHLADAFDHCTYCEHIPAYERVYAYALIPSANCRIENYPLKFMALPFKRDSPECYRQKTFSMLCRTGTLPSLMKLWQDVKHTSLLQVGTSNSSNSVGDYFVFKAHVLKDRSLPTVDILCVFALSRDDKRKLPLRRALNACYVDPMPKVASFLFRLLRYMLEENPIKPSPTAVRDTSNPIILYEQSYTVFDHFLIQFRQEFRFEVDDPALASDFDFESEWRKVESELISFERLNPYLMYWKARDEQELST